MRRPYSLSDYALRCVYVSVFGDDGEQPGVENELIRILSRRSIKKGVEVGRAMRWVIAPKDVRRLHRNAALIRDSRGMPRKLRDATGTYEKKTVSKAASIPTPKISPKFWKLDSILKWKP